MFANSFKWLIYKGYTFILLIRIFPHFSTQRILEEVANVRNLMQTYHQREMRQFDTLRDQITDVARYLTFLLKNPPKQGISVMQILPWAGMVLMPLIMRFMKTDEGHQILKEMQDEIRKFAKEQEKAEDTKA